MVLVRPVVANLNSIDVKAIRQSFANIDEMTYLNTGTEGFTPGPVLDRLVSLTQYCETLGQASTENSRGHIEATRSKMARFLGVDKSTTAFPENATEAVNWVAASLNFNPVDEIDHLFNEMDAYLQRHANMRASP